MKLLCSASFGLLLLSMATAPITRAQASEDPPVVPSVDLARYSGLWKEMARYPTFFQKGCARSTAEYQPLTGSLGISVLNTCFRSDGSTRSINGKAMLPHPEQGAKLRVDFGWFRRGDYWIVDLDPEYHWVIVSGPSKKSLFVLTREAPVPAALRAQLIGRLKELGFEVDKLIWDAW